MAKNEKRAFEIQLYAAKLTDAGALVQITIHKIVLLPFGAINTPLSMNMMTMAI